jgi:hypothetical protein
MSLGFIILRHINSTLTGEYWQRAYTCIRKLYPDNPILVVDDNSVPEYANTEAQTTFVTHNCTIVNSPFPPQRAELLPYFFFHTLKPFDRAVILQDSVYIHQPLQLDNMNDCIFFWHFYHNADEPVLEQNLINHLAPATTDLLKSVHANQAMWFGCLGTMCVIDWTFLDRIVTRYQLFNLLHVIDNRLLRMGLERVFAVVATCENPALQYNHWPSLFGWDFPKFQLTFEEYKAEQAKYEQYPAVKVWTGR